jgi:hypothetical protein
MAAADIERFMKNARVRLPGATDDALQLELFNTMDEFFKGSNVWREDIAVAIGASQPAGTIYYVVPEGPALVDRLMWTYQAPTDPNQLRGPQVLDVAMSIPGELTLGTQPSQDLTYVVTVSLTVQDPIHRDGYVSFPAWVLARYRNAILDGLLGKMFSQPAKPWTNNQLAVLHLRKFASAIATARNEANKNNVYKAQSWRFPSFAGGNSRGGRSRWAPPQ